MDANIRMRLLLYITLAITTTATAEDATPKAREKDEYTETLNKEDIAMLEKEKAELYKQLTDALEDGVQNLKSVNNSEAKVGLALFNDIQKQLKSNGTVDIEKVDFDKIVKEETKTRRQGKKKSRRQGDNIARHRTKTKLRPMGREKLVMDEDDFTDELKEKRYRDPKSQKKYDNRGKMQERVAEWINAKIKEREAIQKYEYEKLQKSKFKVEECPSLGNKQGSTKKKGQKMKPAGKYPCCRKCCKFSYMGCLKKK